ncbi:MAG: aspartate aminotransferase family protein [Leucobacter sp.]
MATESARQDNRPHWLARAQSVLPDGVSSYARFRADQIVFQSATGSRLTDVEDSEYVDCVLGFGPLFLGHRPKAVVDAVHKVIDTIDLNGGVTPGEIELAEQLIEAIPFAEKILFQSTGSEAGHLALRIARSTTARPLIVKFDGHYHGWLDPIFTNAPGSEEATRHPDGTHSLVPNVSSVAPDDTDLIVLDWGDLESLRMLMEKRGTEVAAVVMEPIPFNFGAFAPNADYLQAVRDLCDQCGSLLIFDEVVSGFRVGVGGAQALVGVSPDLAMYGKAIGSGFPLAFVAGTDAALSSVASGQVHQGGTYNAHPIGVAAGLATMNLLNSDADLYLRVEALAEKLQTEILNLAAELQLPLTVNRVASVLQVFWGLESNPTRYAEALQSDKTRIAELFATAAQFGAYLAPRGLLYVSAAHTSADLDIVVNSLRLAALQLRN